MCSDSSSVLSVLTSAPNCRVEIRTSVSLHFLFTADAWGESSEFWNTEYQITVLIKQERWSEQASICCALNACQGAANSCFLNGVELTFKFFVSAFTFSVNPTTIDGEIHVWITVMWQPYLMLPRLLSSQWGSWRCWRHVAAFVLWLLLEMMEYRFLIF